MSMTMTYLFNSSSVVVHNWWLVSLVFSLLATCYFLFIYTCTACFWTGWLLVPAFSVLSRYVCNMQKYHSSVNPWQYSTCTGNVWKLMLCNHYISQGSNFCTNAHVQMSNDRCKFSTLRNLHACLTRHHPYNTIQVCPWMWLCKICNLWI